jgi:hypothetical protein
VSGIFSAFDTCFLVESLPGGPCIGVNDLLNAFRTARCWYRLRGLKLSCKLHRDGSVGSSTPSIDKKNNGIQKEDKYFQ